MTKAEVARLYAHQTMRVRRADGRYELQCFCGWRSAPAVHPDMLGWTCPVSNVQHDCDETCSCCPTCYQTKDINVCGRTCEHAEEN